jgi:hypothetical protein
MCVCVSVCVECARERESVYVCVCVCVCVCMCVCVGVLCVSVWCKGYYERACVCENMSVHKREQEQKLS